MAKAQPKASPSPGAAAKLGPNIGPGPTPIAKANVSAVPPAQKKAMGNAMKGPGAAAPPPPTPAKKAPIAGGNPAPVKPRRKGVTPPAPAGTPSPTKHVVITHVASGPYQAPYHERIAGSKEVRAVPTSVVFVVGMGLLITNAISTGQAQRLWELIYDGKDFVRNPGDPPIRVLLGETLFIMVLAFLSQINDSLATLILVFFFGLWVLWVIQNGNKMRGWIASFTGELGKTPSTPSTPTPVAPAPLPGALGYTIPSGYSIVTAG